MKFLRQDIMRHSKLGKNRKKLQKWRAPTGRHSKMRQKRKSYPTLPTVGHKSPKIESGKINGLFPILVHNTNDLAKVGKNNIVIIAKVGAKKKLEIIKKVEEMKLKVYNLGGKSK